MKRTLILVLALLSAGCTVAHVVDSWKAAGAKPFKRSNKRVVLVVANDPERRARAETKLAEEIKAVPLRSLFGDDELKDGVAVKARLLEQGFTELVVLRVEVETERSMRRLSVWKRWLTVGVPYASNTRLDLITSVYDIAEGDLVWQLESFSYDPSSVESLLEEHAKAGIERLKADGMLVD
ncbi:MAG: hypothetical protein Q8N23_04465 [Archangium sp.]|nr:hypothetical protein [Archangium sp.]MDP3151896.1 hypothetical protein [Archangium sp.]MDP3571309.1 hypothetical protein [Archangium sp.]